MPRGKAEFPTMKCIETEAGETAHLYKDNLKKREPDINGGPGKTVREDPMRNLMTKGLVHHMDFKGLVKDAIDEAKASLKK